MDRYQKIAASFYNQPLLISYEKLQEIEGLLEVKFAGGQISDETIQAAVAAKKTGSEQRAGAVAVLPIFGVIAPRMDLMMQFSGGVSLESLTRRFRALVDDSSVGAIILNIDSPGGSVYGLDEFAEEVYKARDKKKIVAIANSMAASAAYWIGTAAHEFVAIKSSDVGSIGVWMLHMEYSRQLEEEGVGATIISAGKFKTEGNDIEPLSEEATLHFQQRVDHWYDMFVEAVARNRGIKTKDVIDGFGEGRSLPAGMALKENMIDGIETLDELITRLSSPKEQNSGGRAAARSRELELASL